MTGNEYQLLSGEKMKTVKELIANLENTPKRKGIRYVAEEDIVDVITCLKAFEQACETLVNVADFFGVLKENTDD